MATNFPTSLDALTNPTSSDSLSSPSHSAQHANVNDAVEALQAKVGVDSSAVTSSHDYKIADHASRLTTLEGAAGSGLVFISRTTVGSAVSSVTVSGTFSADYDNYRIVVNMTIASANLDLLFTIGAASTAYYSSKVLSARFDGGSGVTGLVNNGSAWNVGSAASGAGGSISIDILSPFLTEETKYSGTAMYGNIASGAAMFTAGALNNATSYTGFTMATSSGTISGGSIDVYGYAKA